MDEDATQVIARLEVVKIFLQCPFPARPHQYSLSGWVFKRNPSDSQFNNFFNFKHIINKDSSLSSTTSWMGRTRSEWWGRERLIAWWIEKSSNKSAAAVDPKMAVTELHQGRTEGMTSVALPDQLQLFRSSERAQFMQLSYAFSTSGSGHIPDLINPAE